MPRDKRKEIRTDDDATVHDQLLWVFRKAGLHDLLLYMASSQNESQYCLHFLEIISLIFREQDPKSLASANFKRSKEERDEDVKALIRLKHQEEVSKKVKPARHSRFGGSFTLTNIKSISDDKNLIYHKPLSTLNTMNFDGNKRGLKVSKNRTRPSDFDTETRRSTLGVRLFLKDFCLDFINGAYNKLMRLVKDNLDRHRAQKDDETYYLWAIKFFMEFNRSLQTFRVDLVSETLSSTTYYFITQKVDEYKDNYDHEKRNRPKCLLFARRMHLAIRAVHELLLNLVKMSNDSSLSQSATVLKANILYEPEYREMPLMLFSIYKSETMSLGFLRDLVSMTHTFLKLMENASKNKHLMVKSKKVRRKKKKASKSISERENNEQKWDKISSEVSHVLRNETEFPDIPPFDSLSEESMEDQKVKAVFKIQEFLLKNQIKEAIGFLRASRQVWPENDSFGTGEDLEEEFVQLRQILFLEKPISEEAPDEDEEDEFEEEEVEIRVSEQEFDFKAFLGRFASKNVTSAISLLLSNFKKNSGPINHCAVKMLHRIAWDCGQPAMIFHVSFMRIFQEIHREYKLNPDPVIKEMNKFASYILTRFFEVSQKNPKVFMELCFWKTPREAEQIVEGYRDEPKNKRLQYWTEDQEETLERVFKQLKEEENEDMLDAITAHFSESNKSRRQVAKKLRDMGLIQNIREVTRKSLKAKIVWNEEEVEKLKSLWEEFKEAHKPVQIIKDHLGTKRTSRKIADKIMELGLCSDRKLLYQKVRSSRRENRENVSSESESDSALEDSSSGEEENEEGDEEDAKEVIESVKEMKEVLKWLRESFEEEAKDRDEDPDEVEDVALVPMAAECSEAMEKNENIKKLLKMLKVTPPNEQERYWRLGASMSSSDLGMKSKLIGKIEEGQELGKEDLQCFNKEKMKKEKRGPNKWMPMRRTLDDQVMERIQATVPKSQREDKGEETKKKRNKAKGKETKKKKEDKAFLDDSSSEDEEEETKKKKSFLDNSSSEEETELKITRKNIIDTSSSEDEKVDESDKENTQKKKRKAKETKKKRQSFLEEYSSEDEEEVAKNKGAKNKLMPNDSSSEEEKELTITSKAIIDTSSSENEDDEKMKNTIDNKEEKDRDGSNKENNKKKKDKGIKKKKQTIRNRKAILDDSSSGDEGKEVKTTSKETTDTSSSEDEDEEKMKNTVDKEIKKKKNRSVLDDSSSEDEKEEMGKQPTSNKCKAILDDSSSGDEEKEKEMNITSKEIDTSSSENEDEEKSYMSSPRSSSPLRFVTMTPSRIDQSSILSTPRSAISTPQSSRPSSLVKKKRELSTKKDSETKRPKLDDAESGSEDENSFKSNKKGRRRLVLSDSE